MIKRHLEKICFHEEFGRQMRFISGPRQIGKTTLAKHILKQNNLSKLYFNWDLREIRDKYHSDPYFFETSVYDATSKSPWVCMDEIHKMPKWKNILKDYFDRFEESARFIVTGSARLDLFRKSGDALSGRYFLFRLLPLTLSEAAGKKLPTPYAEETALDFIERRISKPKYERDLMAQLLEYSGFPEPFTKASNRFSKLWQREMADQIIREDVRELTRIIDLENIAALIQLIPYRIGSPLSINSLKEDIQVSYTAVNNAISAMELTYIIFRLSPYSQKIARSLIKEKKCYFYDWTRCEDPSIRFENYIAVELKTLTELWNSSGIADFSLHYVRTKDGKETDFLVVKNKKPWCLFEVKLNDKQISNHHLKHAHSLGDIPLIQLVNESKVLKKPYSSVYRISASRFLS